MNWMMRIYLLILHLYPRRFFENFAGEMPGVFADALNETSRRGAAAHAGFVLRELLDLPASILREHIYAMRTGNAGVNPSFAGATPSGNISLGAPGSTPRANDWLALLTGLLPFLWGPVFALVTWLFPILWKLLPEPDLPPSADSPAFAGGITFYFIVLLLLLVIPLLVVAWRRGFPAWSYPLGVQALLICLISGQATFPGIVIFGRIFDIRLNGLWSFTPLLVIAIIALISTRRDPLKPLRAGVKGFEDEIHRMMFGLFGLSPLLLRIHFDGVQGEGPFLIGMDIVLALTALIYLRGRKTGFQAAAIFAGLVLAWLASAIYLGIYWNGRQFPGFQTPEDGIGIFTNMLFFGLVIIVITFIPWEIQRYVWRSKVQKEGN